MNREERGAIIERALALVAEHFDAVEILASRVADGGDETEMYARGAGNFYTRLGMARDWLVRCDEDSRQERRPAD